MAGAIFLTGIRSGRNLDRGTIVGRHRSMCVRPGLDRPCGAGGSSIIPGGTERHVGERYRNCRSYVRTEGHAGGR
jgi:hypothetical protein